MFWTYNLRDFHPNWSFSIILFPHKHVHIHTNTHAHTILIIDTECVVWIMYIIMCDQYVDICPVQH